MFSSFAFFQTSCGYFRFFTFSCRRRQWHPTPALLPGKSHGRRSLVGYSPWGCEELDTTERLHFQLFTFMHWRGNGNPLQCSCLENPRDSRAWWAAVYGVTQSRTRLKWLSSSSSEYWKDLLSGSTCAKLSNTLWKSVSCSVMSDSLRSHGL